MSTTEALNPPTADSEGSYAHTEDDWRRVVRFATIAGTIVLLANALVWGTWGHFSGMQGWATAALISAVVPVTFIVTTLVGFRYTHPLLRIVYSFSAAWLGALNYAVFASLACWLVGWPLEWVRGAGPSATLASVLFGSALIASIYGLINAAWIRVTRLTVPLPNLPKAWEGRTAALITDLHLGHVAGPAFMRRVISHLRSLRPEVVLISGDLFDGSPLHLDRLLAGWEGFSAERGVFYVTGNHDEFSERGVFLRAVDRAGIRVLNNEKVTVEGLQIFGVHDSEAGQPEILRQILRRAGVDRQRPSILLAHRPVNLPVAEAEGISLQLSGHTHAGQFWPWNLVVRRVWGQFAYGLSRLGGLLVYTSSGVGTWGPPLRVGTKAEIVLLRFENAGGTG